MTFELKVGEIYAILPENVSAHHGGEFVGYLDIGAETWLAFDIGEKVKFYNPRHIRSLLPEKRPE